MIHKLTLKSKYFFIIVLPLRTKLANKKHLCRVATRSRKIRETRINDKSQEKAMVFEKSQEI